MCIYVKINYNDDIEYPYIRVNYEVTCKDYNKLLKILVNSCNHGDDICDRDEFCDIYLLLVQCEYSFQHTCSLNILDFVLLHLCP